MLFITLWVVFVFSSYSHAHLGFQAPPVDVTNAAGTSHSGFGNYSSDDFQASILLQKSCTDYSRLEGLVEACKASTVPEPTKEWLANKMAPSVTIPYFREYAAKVLYSELQLASFDSDPLPARPSCASESDPAPHQSLRRSAMFTRNLVSATILKEIYTGLFTELKHDTTTYNKRLDTNYAILFSPVDRSRKLLKLLKKGVDFNGSIEDINSHRDTMQAVMAKLVLDSNFNKSVNNEIARIKREYASNLKPSLDKICSMSIEEMAKEYPGIFQQAIIDMPTSQRKIANLHLCQEKFYYDPLKFDSDCDGVPDSSDSSPLDPFAPKTKFHRAGTSGDDPPFVSTFDYSVSGAPNSISISTSLKFEFDEKFSENQRAQFLGKIRQCLSDLDSRMKASFQELAKEPPYLGKEIDIKFNVAEGSVGFTGSGGFKVHKCWCSTCNVKLSSWVLFDTYIPQDTCQADFTPKMWQALSNRRLNPYSNRWFEQEDAENLTIRTASDCFVVNHESMHRLGLPDEYNADYYPFNRIGPHDSQMHLGREVYPRHLAAILSPKQCSMEKGNQ